MQADKDACAEKNLMIDNITHSVGCINISACHNWILKTCNDFRMECKIHFNFSFGQVSLFYTLILLVSHSTYTQFYNRRPFFQN